MGAVVPEVRLGADGRLVGAAATQATAKWSYKLDAVRLLGEGHDATVVVDQVTAGDPEREHRQLGVVGVDSQATYTGAACLDWAGGRSGADADGRYAIQGNILVGEQVVAEMERSWLDTVGLSLERRLIAALLAGDEAGGDTRGRESAALIVAAPGEGYDDSGVRVDLRVDEHPEAPRAGPAARPQRALLRVAGKRPAARRRPGRRGRGAAVAARLRRVAVGRAEHVGRRGELRDAAHRRGDRRPRAPGAARRHQRPTDRRPTWGSYAPGRVPGR